MEDAYWKLTSVTRRRLREEIAGRDLVPFLCEVAREACRVVESARSGANGGDLHNFIRTDRLYRRIITVGDPLAQSVLDAVNAIGREGWDIVVNHLILTKLDRRRA